VGYCWKGPFNTYNFCTTHFLPNPIFTGVKVKIKNLLKRNLPTPVGSAERIFFRLASITHNMVIRYQYFLLKRSITEKYVLRGISIGMTPLMC